MSRTIYAYVRACPSCQRNKPSTLPPGGLLQPLPTPETKWEQITMDLITDLPATKHGHDAIVTSLPGQSKDSHVKFILNHSDHVQVVRCISALKKRRESCLQLLDDGREGEIMPEGYLPFDYTSWQKRFNKLRAELGMQEETLQARVREGHLPSFRAYVRWSIYERDRAVREEGARNKSTLATYMQHYNDDINYFKPQPYLCTGPLSKGMELIMQLRAGILPLNAMTAKFGRQSASRQSARRECCKSCDLGPELGGEVESPEHFLFDCPVYQAQRQKLWEKLTSDPDVAAKCQILDGKSDEEKLHSMLNEEFWGVDVDEESGLVYGPFKHAFKCIAKYVAAAWKIRNAYAHPSDAA